MDVIHIIKFLWSSLMAFPLLPAPDSVDDAASHSSSEGIATGRKLREAVFEPGRDGFEISPAIFRPESEDSLPRVILAGELLEVSPGQKNLDTFDYAIQPESYRAKGGETIEEVVRLKLPTFMGEAYKDVKDSSGEEAIISSFTAATLSINGISRESGRELKPGQELKLPGVSPFGDPLWKDGGKTLVWGFENQTVKGSDGVIERRYDGGRVEIERPDGSSFMKHESGLEENSRILPDGRKITERSDNTSTIYDPSTRTTINRSAEGVVETIEESGRRTVEKPDGSKEIFNSDRSRIFEDGKGNRTVTDASGDSIKTDSTGRAIGYGLERGKYTLDVEAGDKGIVYRAQSRDKENPDFRFDLKRSQDGTLSLIEGGKDKGFPDIAKEGPGRAILEQREQLLELVEERIDNPILKAKFLADMIRFENRASERNLSSEKVSGTYRAVSRLLQPDTGGNATKLGADDRLVLAEQLMGNLANPFSISQGNHGTCVLKSLEVGYSIKHPDVISKLVADVAVDGKYVTANGVEVEVPDSTLKREGVARLNPPPEGERSYVGQIVDSTLINASFKIDGEPYRLEQMEELRVKEKLDSSDILVDNKTGKPRLDSSGKPEFFKGMSAVDVGRLSREILGAEYDSGDKVLTARQVDGFGIGHLHINSLDQLRKELASRKAGNSLPSQISINVNMPPFKSDTNGSGDSITLDSAGRHMVNVVDYDSKTGKVKIDNQWGRDADRLSDARSVSLEELYQAAQPPEQILKDIAGRVIAANEHRSPAERELQVLKELKRVSARTNPSYFGGLFATQGEKLGRDYSKLDLDSNSDSDSGQDIMRFFEELPPDGKIGFLYGLVGSPKAIQRFGEDRFGRYYAEAGLELGFDAETLKNNKSNIQREIYFRGLFYLMNESQQEAVLRRMKRP